MRLKEVATAKFSFDELRTKGLVYVDKTDLLARLASDDDAARFRARRTPRGISCCSRRCSGRNQGRKWSRRAAMPMRSSRRPRPCTCSSSSTIGRQPTQSARFATRAMRTPTAPASAPSRWSESTSVHARETSKNRKSKISVSHLRATCV